MTVVILIVIAVVFIIFKQCSPEAAQKREEARAEAERKAAEDAARISASPQAQVIAEGIAKEFEDVYGDAIKYLREQDAFLTLKVTHKDVLFFKHSFDRRWDKELTYSEDGKQLLPLRDRVLFGISFEYFDMQNLPSDSAAKALEELILDRLDQFDYLNIARGYDNKITYRPAKTGW